MDASDQPEVLPPHELVGRRLRDDPGNPVVLQRDGGVRILVGAFREDRVNAHLSVDRFWAGSVGQKVRQRKIAELADICAAEGWLPMKGWACTRADLYCKVPGLIHALATPKNGVNPHHADLIKDEWVLVRDVDKGRVRRDKAHMLAQVVADLFNTLLAEGQAEVIGYPAADEPPDAAPAA